MGKGKLGAHNHLIKSTAFEEARSAWPLGNSLLSALQCPPTFLGPPSGFMWTHVPLPQISPGLLSAFLLISFSQAVSQVHRLSVHLELPMGPLCMDRLSVLQTPKSDHLCSPSPGGLSISNSTWLAAQIHSSFSESPSPSSLAQCMAFPSPRGQNRRQELRLGSSIPTARSHQVWWISPPSFPLPYPPLPHPGPITRSWHLKGLRLIAASAQPRPICSPHCGQHRLSSHTKCEPDGLHHPPPSLQPHSACTVGIHLGEVQSRKVTTLGGGERTTGRGWRGALCRCGMFYTVIQVMVT